jgi:Glutamine amidotransferase domain/Asparagine synthase
MSQIFGWLPVENAVDTSEVVDRMAAALQVHAAQRLATFAMPGLGIGVLEPPALEGETDDFEPGVSRDRRFSLWMAGEAFVSGDAALPLRDAAESRTRAFRRRLLERWLEVGVEVIRKLDGEYHIAIWDSHDSTLVVANDRFGGLPLYTGSSADGLAFAGGVRGVLMAPGIGREPDEDALREAVTFGGYRLEDRTNVRSVRMVGGATLQRFGPGRRRAERYWTWRDIPPQPADDARAVVPVVHDLWRRAMSRRMGDRARYGQTLSGGLDSRAILAEGARGPEWTAITYGLPGCDDAKYARRAAEAQRASWLFLPLYDGDWLRTRSEHIQATDGLIELGDLMHLESLPLQRSRFDVHVSGYIGDAVSGPTFAALRTDVDVMHSLPWYSTAIGMPYDAALQRVRGLIGAIDGAAVRFATFDNKLPQSTNRWTAAWRPWLRVRKPFVDYAFFDFCQGLPAGVRVEGRLHERWLRTSYPNCFAAIPNHKTGMPALTAPWRVTAARVRRGALARLLPWIPSMWRPAARVRSYHDNDRLWREPGTIDAITAPIVRNGAFCAGVFEGEVLRAFVDRWRQTAAAPAQAIGALYVYETYHAGLGRALAEAAVKARELTRARCAVRQ